MCDLCIHLIHIFICTSVISVRGETDQSVSLTKLAVHLICLQLGLRANNCVGVALLILVDQSQSWNWEGLVHSHNHKI